MTATPEMIQARQVVLALLVDAKPKGLAHEDLVARVLKRVKGLSDTRAREVIQSLGAGGAGRGVPQIHKKAGRWMTHMMVAPAEVKVFEVDERTSMAEAAEAKRAGRQDKILTFLENAGDWVSKQQLLDGVGPVHPKLMRRLLAEKLVLRVGATTSTRYAAASLQLALPDLNTPSGRIQRASPARADAGRVAPERGGAGTRPTALQRAIAKVRDALDELEDAAKAA